MEKVGVSKWNGKYQWCSILGTSWLRFQFQEKNQMSDSGYTLNKKSLNGQGNSMVTVLHKKFLAKWRNYAAIVFSWVNQGIVCSTRHLTVIIFQGGKLCPNKTAFIFGINPLQLAQEKGKKLSRTGFYWVFQDFFLRVYHYDSSKKYFLVFLILIPAKYWVIPESSANPKLESSITGKYHNNCANTDLRKEIYFE